MKNSLKNLKLWQKKRNELPVSDDKHADWLDFNALLDQHMPVTASAEKVSWLRSKKLKTFALTFVSFSAAAMVYVVSSVYHSKNKGDKNEIHYRNHSRVNSGSANLKDSVTRADRSFKRDSADLLNTNNTRKMDSISPGGANLLNSPSKGATTSSSKKPGEPLLVKNNGDKNNALNSIRDKATSENVDNTTGSKRNAASKDIKYDNGHALNSHATANSTGNTAYTSLNNKPGKSSFPGNGGNKVSAVKNNPDKTAAYKNEASDKAVAKTDLAHSNSRGSKPGNANTTNNSLGKTRIHTNKLYSGATAAVPSVSSNKYKNMHRRNSSLYGSVPNPGKLNSTDEANSGAPASPKSQSIHRKTNHHPTNKKIKYDNDEKDTDENGDDQENVTLNQAAPKVDFGVADAAIKDAKLPLIKPAGVKEQAPGTTKGNKKIVDKAQTEKTKSSFGNSIFSKMDWGLLLGANSSGSFTPKNQDANFYGSAPVDFFVGISASYNFNPKWALYSQVKVLSPQNISYNYLHVNDGLLDSARLQLNSSRKIYSLEIPLQLSYRINNYLTVRVGPMVSIPMKHANITNRILTPGTKSDSAYFVSLTDSLKNTKYLPKLNFGLSGGVNFQFKRLSFGVMWNQSLSSYQINSDVGTYSAKPGTFQFNIGWQLDKVKLK